MYLLGIVVATISPSRAENAADLELLAQGITAFREANYAEARVMFEQAKAAGNDTSLLHYNMGVTDYWLAYYPSAVDSFKKASNDPALEALAYYNLGLVYARMNNINEASRWFLFAQEAAADAQLKQLAVTAYARVIAASEQTFAHVPARLPLSATENASAPAAENNVLRFSIETSAGAADTVVSNSAAVDRLGKSTGDQYVALQLALGVRLSPLIDAQLYGSRRDYVSLNAFDLATFGMGLGYRYPLTSGGVHYGADFDYVSQGESESQRITTLHIDGAYDFTSTQQVRIGYRRGIITALDTSYEYISGQRDVFEVGWSISQQRRSLFLFGQYEYNDRSDYYEKNEFIASTSPSRFALGLTAGMPFWQFETSITGSFALSVYGDEDHPANGVHRKRRDETLELQARVAWLINKRSRVSADYQMASNRSVFTRYAYDYNRLSLSFQWSV